MHQLVLNWYIELTFSSFFCSRNEPSDISNGIASINKSDVLSKLSVWTGQKEEKMRWVPSSISARSTYIYWLLCVTLSLILGRYSSICLHWNQQLRRFCQNLANLNYSNLRGTQWLFSVMYLIGEASIA